MNEQHEPATFILPFLILPCGGCSVQPRGILDKEPHRGHGGCTLHYSRRGMDFLDLDFDPGARPVKVSKGTFKALTMLLFDIFDVTGALAASVNFEKFVMNL